MAITFSKLKSGNWGVRSDAPLSVGQKVRVEKRGGGYSPAVIEAQVYAGGGAYLYAIRDKKTPQENIVAQAPVAPATPACQSHPRPRLSSRAGYGHCAVARWMPRGV